MATSSNVRRNTGKKRTATKKNRKRGSGKTNAKSSGFSIVDEILLWIVLALSAYLFISNFGLGGFVGEKITDFCFGIFGFLAYIFPFLLFLWTGFSISNKGNKLAWIKICGTLLLFISLCGIFELIVNKYENTKSFIEFYQISKKYKTGGGLIGGILCKTFSPALGVAGSYVILIILIIIAIVMITQRSIFEGMKSSGSKMYHTAKNDAARRRERSAIRREQAELQRQQELEKKWERLDAEKEMRLNKKVRGVDLNSTVMQKEERPAEIHEVIPPVLNESSESEQVFHIQRNDPIVEEAKEAEMPALNSPDLKKLIEKNSGIKEPDTNKRQKSKSTTKEQEEGIRNVEQEIEAAAQIAKPNYKFPTLSLLKKARRGKLGDSDKELRDTAQKLQQTLHSFGVGVKVTNVSCGPTVTRYELTPEQGVKVSRIVNLSDDIKLNLAAADIRIEAPIPGKSAVGIEVPNHENNAVLLRELLESGEFRDHPSNLAFAAGKDIGGKVVVTDIARMPHLLIAGATGSGKSVCINTIIMSILYKAKPEDVKLIMIDPKVVELSVYNGIPHLFIPVVTDPKKAAGALNWGVAEMEDRYKKFAELNVRDLKGYNQRIASIQDIEEENIPEKLPQIVIIVDELADLMMVAPGEVEDSICRLAQLARAAGIHLIIATQRPSVNVITGVIKANMPSRIAFSVSSGVDSRTIIDMHGAEKLLGKGDMLFYPQGYQKPARLQGAFVSDSEVGAVVEYLKEKNKSNSYNQEIEEEISKAQVTTKEVNGSSNGSDRGVDSYFVDAGKFIIDKDKASIGMLQRVFKIGFNRAARIMDQLSEAGVVGPEEGTKPRKILMSMEDFEHYIEESLI